MVAEAIRTGRWTPGLVWDRLVLDFRERPYQAVYIRPGGDMVSILTSGPNAGIGWVQLATTVLVVSDQGRLDCQMLLAAARQSYEATGDRHAWRHHMEACGWKPWTCKRAIGRATEAIADALNAHSVTLRHAAGHVSQSVA